MHRSPLAVLASVMLAGCLAEPFSPCTSDLECRDAFGFGQVCGEAGYCEDAVLPARCTSSEPPGIIDDLGSATGTYVMVGTYDGLYDLAEEQSARLAIKEVNGRGGIDGQQVTLIECSYEENPEVDELDYAGAIGLIADYMTGRLGVQGYVGPYASSAAEGWYNTVDQYDPIPFTISGAATSPALTYIDGITHTDADPGVFWRTIPPDSLQGKVAAADMINRGRSNVAVVYQEGAYGEGLAQIFTDEFTAAGGDVTALKFGSSDELAAHVAALNSDDTIEEVFVISGEAQDISDFLNAAVTLGGFADTADTDGDGDVDIPEDRYPATGKGIFLPDAGADVDLLTAATSAGPLFDCRPDPSNPEEQRCDQFQVRGTRPALPDNTLYDSFRAAYQSEYHEDPNATVYMPFAYDAAWLAIYSTAWAHYNEGEITGQGMGAGMRHVTSGATEVDLLPTGWPTADASFQAGQAINVEGTSGPLDFDPLTEETATAIEIWVVNDTTDGFEVEDRVEPE